MERVFTETVGRDGRWPKGHRADWPLQTWRHVAANVGRPLDSFSAPVEAVVAAGAGAPPPKAASRRGRGR